MKNLSTFFKNISMQSIAFYALLFFASLPLIDYEKIFLSDRIKTSYFEKPSSVEPLYQWLENKTPIEKQALKEYIFYYEQLVRRIPDSADSYSVLGLCYDHENNLEKAMASYQKAIEINPEVLWFYYNLGVLYFKEGEFSLSIEYLKKAVARRPDNTLDYTKKSTRVLLPIIMKANLSVDNLKRRIKGGYRDSYLLIVINYLRLKNFSEALLIAKRALTLNVGYEAWFYYYAGVASYELKDYPKALSYLQAAVEKSKDLAEAYSYLGLTYKELGQEALSAENFKKAEELRGMKKETPMEDKINLRLF